MSFPDCGYRRSQEELGGKKMKKVLALILAMAMALSLAACGTPSGPAVSDPVEDEIWSSTDENGNLKLTERDDVGENGMVTTANVYATMAGLEVLEQGGNAVDAAIAISYALGVCEPNASGLGGGGFMNIHMADGSELVIDYREVAPMGQDAYTWLDETGAVKNNGTANSVGGLATGVPGTVAGLEYALEHYGSGKLTRQQIMQPAIDMAREGYKAGGTLVGAMNDYYDYMVTDYKVLGDYYLKDGMPYEIGDVITNEDLAKTLELIAEGGKDAFYTGDVAQAIVDTVASYGGVLSMEDLASYEPAIREPVKGTYRGYEIVSCPPASSGGTHIVEVLNILENYDMASLGVNTAESIHLWSEALKACFADRGAYMADTAFADVPLAGLTSKEYAKTIADKITNESQSWDAGEPGAYEGNSTTAYSVADKDGNIVSVTQTIECFWGCKIAIPGYGFIMNDQLHDFSTDPESVNKLEGGKKPLSSMSPTIVLDAEGNAFMSLGSPGGLRIWPTVAQVISNVIDHGMNMQDAIDCARIFERGNADGICYEPAGENAPTAETLAALQAQGHALTEKGAWDLFFGGCQGILFTDDGIEGGADPRRDGKAIGF
ncbi:MAG: gamma-glutamyltransferase [Ruminococcaceae bacterium]|nr:gamma-glutamyltransferase [Oscillospiraceae bacterium]